MRVRTALFALSLCLPAAGVGAAQNRGASKPDANCPRTTSHLADESGLYRGKPLGPRKLTELPPATTYMAVYRHIGACEAPLTMVEYRNPRRR